nr:hypothetical protein [Mesorhizobium carmichaelinearum]
MGLAVGARLGLEPVEQVDDVEEAPPVPARLTARLECISIPHKVSTLGCPALSRLALMVLVNPILLGCARLQINSVVSCKDKDRTVAAMRVPVAARARTLCSVTRWIVKEAVSRLRRRPVVARRRDWLARRS